MANAVAIDVGSTAARAVWVRGTPGNLEVVKALRVELEGESPVGSLVRQIKNEKGPVGNITLGVPGRSATLRYNLLPPVPDWRLELIMKYETEELAEKSGESLTNSFLKLEIPESEADDQILIMGLGKDSMIQPHIDDIESNGGRAHLAMPSAFGLYHAYRQTQKGIPAETVLLADVGAEETQIVMVADGRLLFARSVNFGGSQLDEAIASSLGIKVDAARRLKEGIEERRVPDHLVESAQSAIRSGLGQLLSVLQSSVTFCRAQVKITELKIDRVLLTGAASRLPQMAPFLAEGFDTQVEVFRPQVAGELPGKAHEWVVAVGLAAAQMDRERGYLDLLPPVAKARREFRERTIFKYASVAVLVLALGVHFTVGAMINSEVSGDSERITTAQKDVRTLEQELRTKRQQNEKMESKIQRLEKETLPIRFSATILDRLRSVVPEAISLEELSLEREEIEGQVGIEIHLVGLADNSDRRALEHMDELEGALKALPGVARVSVQTEDVEAGVRRFTLIASPDMERPQPKKNKNKRKSRQRP